MGPGGVAISTPVEGGSAGNGGIAIAGAQGVDIVFAFIDEGNKLFNANLIIKHNIKNS